MPPLFPETTMSTIAEVVGLALSSGVAAGIVALVHRWYAGTRVTNGVALLVGFGVVAVYLNTTAALGQVIGGTTGLLDLETALLNVISFGAAGIASLGGRRLGDRLARVFAAATGTREFDSGVSHVVSAVGRAIAVEIPEKIDDIEGYDPVDRSTKETLSGKTLLFPRRLTLAELHDRIVTRLKEDYRIGHVSLDLADDGTVEHLSIGSRAAGLGPTLPPGSAATAIRADPPFAAAPGDVVQVWSPDSGRIATAEFRAKNGDVVTLALDEIDAETLDPTATYRLVTLPMDARPDREFASLLRDADETFGVAHVGEDSPLVGSPIGALDPTVIAVRPEGGRVEAIPPRSHVLAPGDTVYAIARPESLRRLETAARGPASEAESSL